MTARGFPAAQRRSLLEEFGPRETEEEHRAVDALDDRIGEVEHRRLCPVHVLEHHHERPLGGDDLEQAPDRPGSVGRERLTDPEDLSDAVADRRPVGLAGQPFAECRRHLLGVSTGPAGGLRQQLDERRERDADAVRGGLTHEDGRSLAGRVGELGREARLTHAGGASTVTSTHAPASITSSSASSSILSGRSRPTSGVSIRAATCAQLEHSPGWTPVQPCPSLVASRGSDLVSHNSWRAERQVGSPISTDPGGAPD